MVGYRLKNNRQPFGAVTRGVCATQDGLLRKVQETYKIRFARRSDPRHVRRWRGHPARPRLLRQGHVRPYRSGRKGYFPKGSNVLFLHTGGSPALYAYLPTFRA